MPEEVDRFCDLLAEAEEKSQVEIVGLCCLTLGCEMQRTDHPMKTYVPMRKLFYPFTLEKVREQLAYLVDEVGIDSRFLIEGLFNYLIEHFNAVADPASASATFDNHLNLLERIKRQLELPLDDRDAAISDRDLLDLRKKSEEFLANQPVRAKECADTSEWLERMWDERFPRSYWKDLLAKRPPELP